MHRNVSFVILNDYCMMDIFEYLSLVDFANLASTCSKVRDVAREFSGRKHKKIEIEASHKSYNYSKVSKQEFRKVLSKIGENVVEVKMYNNDSFMIQSIKEKCKNLESVGVYAYHGSQLLQGFRNLKQIKVNSHDIGINQWQYFFASNPGLQVLEYDNRYEDGFMELLTHLPKLQSLQLPWIRRSLHQSPDFQYLLQLTGLTKLTLRSDDNLNVILVDLAKSMNLNLVELNIGMQFDSESFGIIKSFQNLKVLSISSWNDCNEEWLSNITVFPPRLQQVTMQGCKISRNNFLAMLDHLVYLEELNLGDYVEIRWDNNIIRFKDSHAMVIKAVENTLIHYKRKLKILHWDDDDHSLHEYKSEHLHIINSFFVEEKARSQRLHVNCKSK